MEEEHKVEQEQRRSACSLDTPDSTNAKLPGKFKPESGTKPIEEFVTLPPKTYSFKCC